MTFPVRPSAFVTAICDALYNTQARGFDPVRIVINYAAEKVRLHQAAMGGRIGHGGALFGVALDLSQNEAWARAPFPLFYVEERPRLVNPGVT